MSTGGAAGMTLQHPWSCAFGESKKWILLDTEPLAVVCVRACWRARARVYVCVVGGGGGHRDHPDSVLSSCK